MPTALPYLTARGDNEVLLAIYVQPKSSRNKVTGIHDGLVKIAITAPPVDGKANKAVAAFLAKLFKVPKSAVNIVSGQQSRKKKFSISGVNLGTANSILSDKV